MKVGTMVIDDFFSALFDLVEELKNINIKEE